MSTASRSITPLRLTLAIGVGLWLYFLLPVTATAFYELYHLVPIDLFYWIYGGIKAGSYYFGQLSFKWLLCIAVSLLFLAPPVLRSMFSSK